MSRCRMRRRAMGCGAFYRRIRPLFAWRSAMDGEPDGGPRHRHEPVRQEPLEVHAQVHVRGDRLVQREASVRADGLVAEERAAIDGGVSMAVGGRGSPVSQLPVTPNTRLRRKRSLAPAGIRSWTCPKANRAPVVSEPCCSSPTSRARPRGRGTVAIVPTVGGPRMVPAVAASPSRAGCEASGCAPAPDAKASRPSRTSTSMAARVIGLSSDATRSPPSRGARAAARRRT